MKKLEKIKSFVSALAIVMLGVGGALLIPAGDARAAVTCPDGYVNPEGKTLADCTSNGTTNDQNRDLMNILNTIINVVIGLVGFVAVVMIIVGGIQYTTSSGDAGKTTKAKNTIMYGVVGLVISLLAFAIVNFILANVFNAPASS